LGFFAYLTQVCVQSWSWFSAWQLRASRAKFADQWERGVTSPTSREER